MWIVNHSNSWDCQHPPWLCELRLFPLCLYRGAAFFPCYEAVCRCQNFFFFFYYNFVPCLWISQGSDILLSIIPHLKTQLYIYCLGFFFLHRKWLLGASSSPSCNSPKMSWLWLALQLSSNSCHFCTNQLGIGSFPLILLVKESVLFLLSYESD